MIGTPLEGAHVLLVDDDDMIRLMASESLRHAGFIVTDTGAGENALRLFESGTYDIVLLDVMMPGLDGYTVCETIRQHPRGKWLPILMMTGLNDTESIEKAYVSGATDFITKPINWFLLTQRVRYSLRSSQANEVVRNSQRSLADAQRLAKMGNWEWSIKDALFSCSAELRNIFHTSLKLDGTDKPGMFLGVVRQSDRRAVFQARKALRQTGLPYQLVYGICQQDGSIREVFEQAVAVHDVSGAITKVEGITQDVTDRVESQRRLDYLAMHDSLTGLANRKFFRELAASEMERARRENCSIAILTIDIDHFKMINDSLGSANGDQLLCMIATRLVSSVRGGDLLALQPPIRISDTVARIEGDTFMAMVLDLLHPEQAVVVARRLQQAVSVPLTIDSQDLALTASIGIAIFPRDADSIDTLSQHSEKALYAARALGSSNYCFFNEEMNVSARHRLVMESELRQAIANNELLLHYQPKVDTFSGQLVGAEALVRWQHPKRGFLAPGAFIPMAEDLGLIASIGDWVVTESARQLKVWLDAGLNFGRLSINLASASFHEDNIVEKLVNNVRLSGLLPDNFIIELTESQLMNDAKHSIKRLHDLREAGFGLSLDDFGTGYSSLSYLLSFPIDELKIDRSFVSDITKSHRESAIARSIIELGRQFGMNVIAEGVETREQSRFLLDHHCPIQQGYLFSAPVSASRFETFLRDGLFGLDTNVNQTASIGLDISSL